MISSRFPKFVFLLPFFILELTGSISKAQEPQFLKAVNDTLVTDDLGEVTDRFQELFFKGLSESGIENYDRAIDYFKKSLDLAPDPSVIHFQLAKNYEKLEHYDEAIIHYKKALQKRPDEEFILMNLLHLYQIQGDTEEALQMAQELVSNHPAYYLDMAQLEAIENRDIKALQHLHALEQKKGETGKSMALRQRIYRETKKPQELISYFEDKIQKNPANPQNLKALIQLHYLHGRPERAYTTALQLKAIAPQEPEVFLGLYPHYINTQEKKQAIQAMRPLIQEDNLSKNIKMRVIRDFTHFVKDHPEYEEDLIATLGAALNEGDQSNKELAEYYKNRDPQKALQYLEKAVQENPRDFNLIKETIRLYMEEEEYKKVLELSDRALQYFPTQAFLYLVKGKALNKLDQSEKAKENLLDGVDFVIEDKTLLGQFYKALIEVYTDLKQEDQLHHYTEQLKSLKL